MPAPLPTLVCPRCRRADEHGLHLGTLIASPAGLSCLQCAAEYPVVDGIPVIARDCAPLLAIDTPGSAGLADIYARSTAGPLQDWLRDVVPAGALELGGGVGARPGTVVLDQGLGMLRRAREAGAGCCVCADLLDPPFLPGAFDVVVLANVLDLLDDPLLAFQQAFALAGPAGRIVVTCPYAFQGADPGRTRFTPADLGSGFGAIQAGALALVDARELDWPLRTTARLTQVHRSDAFVFQKPAA